MLSSHRQTTPWSMLKRSGNRLLRHPATRVGAAQQLADADPAGGGKRESAWPAFSLCNEGSKPEPPGSIARGRWAASAESESQMRTCYLPPHSCYGCQMHPLRLRSSNHARGCGHGPVNCPSWHISPGASRSESGPLLQVRQRPSQSPVPRMHPALPLLHSFPHCNYLPPVGNALHLQVTLVRPRSSQDGRFVANLFWAEDGQSLYVRIEKPPLRTTRWDSVQSRGPVRDHHLRTATLDPPPRLTSAISTG